METKACNLTENEINHLIGMHGCNLGNYDTNERIERINYLHKRLKTFFDESEKPKQPAHIPDPAPATQGWT